MADHARQSRWTRLVFAVAVAAVVVAGGTAVLAAGAASDGDVQATIDAVFAGGCVSPAEAKAGLEAQLASGGLRDWTVESRADGAQCVTAGAIEPDRTVILLPVNGPDVSAAMDQVRAELMDRCLSEAEATEFVSQALSAAGVSEFEITTSGPLGYPRGQEEVVMKHVDGGCFIYSGSGHTAGGTPLFGINGR